MRRNLSITRAFRDPHSVPVSPLEAVIREEPTCLRSDCRREEHRHPRLAGQRAGWVPSFPLPSLITHDRSSTDRAPYCTMTAGASQAGEGALRTFRNFPVRLSCARIVHQARAKKWTFFQRRVEDGVQPSLVCFCVFSSIASQIKRRHVSSPGHINACLCASDGFHVGTRRRKHSRQTASRSLGSRGD